MSDQMLERVGSIVEKLTKGQATYDLISQNLKILIHGKSIEDWTKEFKVAMPKEQATPANLRDICIKIMELHQVAVFHYVLAESIKQQMAHGNDTSFYTRYMELYEEAQKSGTKRLPASLTLESMAKTYNQDMEGAMVYAEIAVKFWRSILDHLSECRKLVEQASMNTSVELKNRLT